MKMTCLRYRTGLSVFLVCLLVASKPVQGQAVPGVSEKEILIGSCSALEGPSHFLGTETVTGAKAYLDMINDAGGVDGRKLKLISYDDSYDPAKRSLLQLANGAEGFRARIFRGDSHWREVCADGGEQQDSSGRALHRSADTLCAIASLGCERASLLL